MTQNAPIMHAAGLDENNQDFTLNYQVTDGDGDTADGTPRHQRRRRHAGHRACRRQHRRLYSRLNRTKSLPVGAPGADDNSTYTITDFASATVVNGVTAG